MSFPIKELIRCAEREIAQRERVYPRLVLRGSMTKEKAEREIAMMQAIRAQLEQLEARECPTLL